MKSCQEQKSETLTLDGNARHQRLMHEANEDLTLDHQRISLQSSILEEAAWVFVSHSCDAYPAAGDGYVQEEEVGEKEEEEDRRRIKGRREGNKKSRSAQQLAGHPVTSWQRRCAERRNGGKLFHPHLALNRRSTVKKQCEYIRVTMGGKAQYFMRKRERDVDNMTLEWQSLT
jgi:hypothetical protein